MIIHHSKAEAILKLTDHSQSLQNYFSPHKIIFVNDEVRAWYTKLGHPTLYNKEYTKIELLPKASNKILINPKLKTWKEDREVCPNSDTLP